MPKHKKPLNLSLNLLKPQNNPEKIPLQMIRWLLSSGRYIFVAVEALVLIAFGARFKLDADLAAKKEAIEEQIPYIESLKPYEILIRQTQLKLATIDNTKKNSFDWTTILKKIADQSPQSVTISSITIAKNINTTLHVNGQTPINGDITSFVSNLREDPTFSSVSLASIVLEENVIKFTLDISVKGENSTGKSL